MATGTMPLSSPERESLRSKWKEIPVAVVTGELLEITYLARNKEVRLPGRRGVVKGFTNAARLRMMRTVATIDWSRVRASLFITLTYPPQVERRSMKERNQDRYVFLRSMENHLGRKVGALWRIEWKTRKTGATKGTTAPHVHLIVFGCGFIAWQEIRRWWRAALAVVGPLATDVQRIKGGSAVGKYVTKYCAKLPDAPSLDSASYLNSLGRHWGIHRRDLIPWSQRHVFWNLSAEQIRFAENAACMTFRYFAREARQGFCIFGDNAKKIGEIYLGMPLNGYTVLE